MQKTSGLKLFFSFVREKAGTLFMLVLAAALFLLIGALSHLPMEPLTYALTLLLLCSLVAGIVAFSRYLRRVRQVEAAFHHPETLPGGLPAPAGLVEDMYQALLSDQSRLRLLEKNAQTKKMKEREDYYTLWMHQIKTPIAAMRLLLQSGKAPGGSQWEEELFKTERYVEMALHYLRLESQADDLSLQTCDMQTLVKKAVKKYALLFIHKKISLELEDFSLQALTDEKWFLVLLEQILSNAVKYTEKGAVRIFVQDGSTLAVADTGTGIPKEDLPMVFERGFTGHNGRADGRATGIGLYLAREVAKKLGHRLAIHSEVGRGTTVMIDVSHIPLEIF